MRWSNEQPIFSNGRSMASTQCAFRNCVNLILFWVTTFKETGSVQKKAVKTYIRPVTSAAKIEAVRVSFLFDEMDLEDTWFEVDRGTARTSRASMVISREHFPDLECPACSPDLAACNFFLWGYLKSRVYTNRPQTIC